MAESNTKERSAVVEKLLNRAPKHEPEVAEAMDAYAEARAKSRETIMLDFRFLDGTIESFSYAYLTRVRFTPEDTIVMRFDGEQVQIRGRNLKRLCEMITEHRARFIQVSAEGDEERKADDAAHVDEISITEQEDV